MNGIKSYFDMLYILMCIRCLIGIFRWIIKWSLEFSDKVKIVDINFRVMVVYRFLKVIRFIGNYLGRVIIDRGGKKNLKVVNYILEYYKM